MLQFENTYFRQFENIEIHIFTNSKIQKYENLNFRQANLNSSLAFAATLALLVTSQSGVSLIPKFKAGLFNHRSPT